MVLMVNPGSKVRESGKGWTNTVELARREALEWLSRIHADGMTDVELLDGETQSDGRWVFTFRHKITGTEVKLETHGVDDLKAYMKENLAFPRVYWNGSSSADPEIQHFAAPGFVPHLTFVPATQILKDAGA